MLNWLILCFVLGFLAVGFIQIVAADIIILGKGQAPIYVSDKDLIHFDINNDGLIDYYVKAHFIGKSNQQYKVDYKIVDECVDGGTYETAKLKIAFSNTTIFPAKRVWFTHFDVWNPWFRAADNDENKRIDVALFPNGTNPDPFPLSGDDVITKNPSQKKGSFTHVANITELDNQPGWDGSVFFRGPPGEYFMWTVHPGDGGLGCDILTGFAIPIIIKP